jgi:hypothetical protein
MSHPWKVNPSGCPAAGPSLLNASSHDRGSTFVNRLGQAAIRMKSAASATENQKSGRRRRSLQASRHRLLGLSAMRTASTEIDSVSTGAT